jgi:formate-dependent phosphoribosylglycinamide formyltransferase (GAR transformylase)
MGAPAYPTRDTWERLALLQPFDLALDGLGERVAGRLHLPLVLSARGVLYAEAIGEAGGLFWQPEPLSDQLRQPLYRLARSLLFGDASPPSPGVYLASFALTPDGVRFERLCPFPDTAALVSLTSQVPDLFTCHWRSALGLPMVDLRVLRPTAARLGKARPATMALTPEAELLLEGRLLTVQGPSVASARRALSAAAVH